ncbi:carbohydrate-binding-like protein [Flagelloscypha sp. PMI_526]|nr:carbohydrate-binding-like protein [Flagelloscypha sp. PMI_526]
MSRVRRERVETLLTALLLVWKPPKSLPPAKDGLGSGPSFSCEPPPSDSGDDLEEHAPAAGPSPIDHGHQPHEEKEDSEHTLTFTTTVKIAKTHQHNSKHLQIHPNHTDSTTKHDFQRQLEAFLTMANHTMKNPGKLEEMKLLFNNSTLPPRVTPPSGDGPPHHVHLPGESDGSHSPTKDTSEPTKITMGFVEYATTNPGENIFLTGDIPELGSWDSTLSIPLTDADYPLWLVEVELPEGTSFNYKFLRKEAEGTFIWESDPNRLAIVPMRTETKGRTLCGHWR